MMLLIRRGHALTRDDDLIVSLVGINGGHPHTGVRIDATDHQTGHVEADKQVVQGGLEKGAVTFLDDLMIRGLTHKFWQALAALSARNRDGNMPLPHDQEGIGQVWSKFLPHPYDGPSSLVAFMNQSVDMGHQDHALLPQRTSREIVVEHVNNEE